MAAEVKKEGQPGFYSKLFNVERPIRYGVLGAALAAGIAILKAVVAPPLFAVMEVGALVGAAVGLVKNLATSASE